MEDKFLKSRQEREEQRHQRSKEGVEATAQRQQYEAEAEQLEAEVTQLLADGKVAESQLRIDALRKLVQDTANSIALTAHDMAKANAILASLQQRVDDAKSTTAGPKKFKFSSRLKTKAADGAAPAPAGAVTPSLPVSASAGTGSDTQTRGASAAGLGNSYGPSSSTDVFIANSKGAFVKSCVDCNLYCLPISGSVFLSNCTRCRVYVACHQLRLKDCVDCELYVWCASTPIIETCDGMRFGPYTCWAGLLRSQTAAGVTGTSHAEWVRCVGEIDDTAHTEQNYAAVDDFQWVRKTPSPHWRVLTDAERTISDTVFGPATPPNKAAA